MSNKNWNDLTFDIEPSVFNDGTFTVVIADTFDTEEDAQELIDRLISLLQ